MIQPASRALIRSAVRPTVFLPARAIAGRRFLSTDPAHLKSRSWKSSALRWGLAAAGIYYYNTSPVFAEQPQYNLLNPNVDALEDDNSSDTLDALTASSRQKAEKNASVLQSAIETTSNVDAMESSSHPATNIPATDASPEELEEEAEGQGAFNPVTGEINWDCPCLGGMAHGPCGPEFREAFSCFVYSTEEPKGMDCIDKFQNMQNCFRAHPDVYKGELEDDEELDAELAQEREDLRHQIAERKAAERDQQGQSDNRLLEEADATPQTDTATSVSTASKPSKQGSSSKKSSKSNSKSSSAKDEHQQRITKGAASSEPQSGMSEEHEVHNKGQKSPSSSSSSKGNRTYPASVTEDEPVPKAAHDAINAPMSEDKQSAK